MATSGVVGEVEEGVKTGQHTMTQLDWTQLTNQQTGFLHLLVLL